MMGVWDDVLEPSVLRPRSSYGVRALVVDVASDPPKETNRGQRRQKKTKHNITKDLVSSTHRCISDVESWTGRLTCGVMVMAPAYIYIYILITGGRAPTRCTYMYG